MLKDIILLTARAEQQVALGALLRAHNPALTVRGALTVDDLARLAREPLRDARLIAFTTGTIVPAAVLDAFGHGAYNFHPGPPDYPGWAPAHFAIYEQAKTFGATAHVMTERVDAGPIVGTETFPIPPDIGVRRLEELAYISLAYLFWRLSKALATESAPLRVLPIRWNPRKSTRRDYAEMCRIPMDISKAELDRRVKAFHDDFRAIYPTIVLHGVEFRAVPSR